mmetsp:Transcript_15452/g.27082  ORF Transcript_15452/g.27082 Transcript_15452/m.27082 type:complete len:350 (-) Transcript_15452:112-1161(-)
MARGGFSTLCFLALGCSLSKALLLRADGGPGSGRTLEISPLEEQEILNSTLLLGAQAPGCACRSVNANLKNKPPGAQANQGQALPDCFPEHPVSAATFVTPASDINTCLLPEGFRTVSLEQKLKCLAPDGKVGTKASPAVYLIGDSHSAMLRTGLGHATSMPVFSASWWGANHSGKVADIEDSLEKVIQKGDVVGYAMRWDARGVSEYEADIDLILKIIKPKGAHLILFEDNPIMKMLPPPCYMAAARGTFPTPCATPVADVTSSHQHFVTAADKYVAENTGIVHFFKLASLFCDPATQTCDYNVPGSWAPAYRDADHISEDGSLYLSPFLCSFMLDAQLHRGGLTNPA